MLFRSKCLAVTSIMLVLTACTQPAERVETVAPPSLVDRDSESQMQAAVHREQDALRDAAIRATVTKIALDIAAWNDGLARGAAQERAEAIHRRTARSNQSRITGRTASAASSGCHFAIPCEIVMRESGGDYSAKNPNSSACGAYQILTGTWDGYGGYPTACAAPPAVQDARAAELWAQSPCHWRPNRWC
jgi:hypothetical protein